MIVLAMEKKIYSLRTNVGYFYNRPIGYTKEFEQFFDEIFIKPDLNLRNFRIQYSLSRTREGLLLQAHLTADMEAQCARCLIPFFAPVTSDFEELFTFMERFQEETDEETIPEDGYIDLGGLFRDYLLIELPMNSVCKKDCKGICIECGQDLNEGECEHTDSRVIFD